MEPMLRDYIEKLFSSAPRTKQAYELKEEIIRNTIDRYHDLLLAGKSEGEAYNLAIAGLGDINELIETLGGETFENKKYTAEQIEIIKNRRSVFTGIAVALYILCVTPCIAFGMINGLEVIGPVLMFIFISVATGLLIYSKTTKYVPIIDNENEVMSIKRCAVLRATAVGLYISCVTPCIFFSTTRLTVISPIFMFLIIAIATVMIILSKNNKTYTKIDDTMVENFKEWNSQKKSSNSLYKILVAILWVTASVLFVLITQAAGLASITVTWLIFLVAVAVQNLMKAIFDYVEASK